MLLEDSLRPGDNKARALKRDVMSSNAMSTRWRDVGLESLRDAREELVN